MLGSPGDRRAEPKLTARYFLAELDSESELLRILTSDLRNRPQIPTAAAEELVSSARTGFVGWIEEGDRAPDATGRGDPGRRLGPDDGHRHRAGRDHPFCLGG